jgi:hypothetical protein
MNIMNVMNVMNVRKNATFMPQLHESKGRLNVMNVVGKCFACRARRLPNTFKVCQDAFETGAPRQAPFLRLLAWLKLETRNSNCIRGYPGKFRRLTSGSNRKMWGFPGDHVHTKHKMWGSGSF